jgi:type VI secretion system protein ImpL
MPRIVAANRVQNQFGLVHSEATAGKLGAPASYSYFLRDLFRKVLFQDQHLIGRQTDTGSNRWRAAMMATGILSVATLAGLWSWSYIGNQKMLNEIQHDRARAIKLASSPQLYDKLLSLQVLQNHLETLQTYRKDGPPWEIGMGLYQGEELEQKLRKEYFSGLKQTMLLPIQRNLETTLVALKEPTTVAPPPPKTEPIPKSKPKQPSRPRIKSKPNGGHKLPNIEIGAAALGMSAQPVQLTRAEMQQAWQAKWWRHQDHVFSLRTNSSPHVYGQH